MQGKRKTTKGQICPLVPAFTPPPPKFPPTDHNQDLRV